MSDPKRLFQTDDDLGGLLRAGKSEVPSKANMDALAAKLGALGLFGGGGFDGGGGGAGGDGGASALKGGAASALKGGALGAAKGGLAVKVLSGVALVTALGGGAVIATNVQGPAPVVVPSGLVAPPPTFSSSSSTSSSASPAPSVTVLEDPLPSAVPSAKARPSAAPSSGSVEPEVKMLARAQDALRGRPAEALAIADEHAKRYPNGMLAQEREVIAIEALVQSGRTADARARAARFEQRFPGSAQLSRVRSLVGTSP